MNVLRAATLAAALLTAGGGAAQADSTNGPMLGRTPDPCCVVVSVGPGGRAVVVESTATRHRWMYYLTGAMVMPGMIVVGAHVDFDPLTGRLFGTDHEVLAGALVSAAN